jgi:glycosyltransferase involved in cell wall biosynthesis
MKISVVMASFLGNYPGCAKNRVSKFVRAVNSFINQNYSNKELVIISDGCDLTENIYKKYFEKYDNIIFDKIQKDVLFGGKTRNRGIELSTGDWICYLDTDDFLSKDHLEMISNQIENEFDWYFSDDYIVKSYNNINEFDRIVRENHVEINRIGTSSIIHKPNLNNSWPDGYAHDWVFIYNLLKKTNKFKKIVASYNVCHIPNLIDL